MLPPESDPLRRRLEALSLDQPGAALPFTARLARDNGWTPGFAARVVAEYRRFLYLAARAGHPVTPSDAVDQAWHLHLVYTESYWRDLCQGILGFPLHHGPTRGGQEEGQKYAQWYERTRASYRRLFSADPPADIWPGAAERFGDASHFRRVNSKHHWVIPRPGLLHRSASTPSTRRSWWTSAFQEPAFVLLVVVCTTLLGMCFMLEAEPWNVLNYTGGPFLLLYCAVGWILVFIAQVARSRLTETGSSLAPVLDPRDPLPVAYLAGGARGAVRAALVALAERGQIQLIGPAPWRIVRRGAERSPARAASAFEQKVLAQIGDGIRPRELTRRVEPDTRSLQHALIAAGLWIPADLRRDTRSLHLLLITIAVSLSGTKAAIGVSRDRPVSALVTATLMFVGLLAYRAIRLPRRTARGMAVLANLRAKYRRFSGRSLRRLREGMTDAEPDLDWVDSMIPLLVGLYGPTIWATEPEAKPYQDLANGGTWSSDTAPTDGAAGGGGGDGGGCGGGDGGGGCGGCSG